MLSKEIFKTVVQNAPLVSIDFIITNNKDEILLGKRLNKPALGYYFTLGGRIFKDEHMKDAMKRIAKEEAGINIENFEPEFLGIFEHFYDNSFVDDNISTHYINFGYKIKVNKLTNLPKKQHNEYRWFGLNELLQSDKVNDYVKNYFKKT